MNKKEFFYQYGDLVIKRKRSMLLQFVGALSTLIYLQFHLVAMILPNKKLGKFLFGHLKMFPFHSIFSLVIQG
jgi:hypothetical protein